MSCSSRQDGRVARASCTTAASTSTWSPVVFKNDYCPSQRPPLMTIGTSGRWNTPGRRGLLTSSEPLTYEGATTAKKDRQRPNPRRASCQASSSPSSAAGMAAAEPLGATAIKYPNRPGSTGSGKVCVAGIRVGIIPGRGQRRVGRGTRPVPGGPEGPTHPRRRDESVGLRMAPPTLERNDGAATTADTYWLWPFQNYKTFCPYLVGSYDRVANESRIISTRLPDVRPRRAGERPTRCAISAPGVRTRRPQPRGMNTLLHHANRGPGTGAPRRYRPRVA